ncbi:hypothetical protein ACIBF1_21255 [Spirillospora sp. NPDC050679]
MSGKRFEEVEVEIDERDLAMLGWRAEEVRGRLVVDSRGGGFEHELAVSGTLRFRLDDWHDRFSAFDDMAKPPPLVLRISRAAPDSPIDYALVALDKRIDQAKTGSTRFSMRSHSWSGKKADSGERLKVGLSAYDFGYGLASKPAVPHPEDGMSPLAVEFADETTREALRMRGAFSKAWVDGSTICVVAEGTCWFAGAEELLTTMLADRSVERPKGRWWRKYTASDEGAFQVRLPAVEIGYLDASGFILDRYEVEFRTPEDFYPASIPVGEGAAVPRREPQWILQCFKGTENLPGTPARVVVRFVDPKLTD